jgi:hypothetical protein
MEKMKGVRILELQKLKSELADSPLDKISFSSSSSSSSSPPPLSLSRDDLQTHYQLLDSLLNRALDLQKGVYEEFINIPPSLSSHSDQLTQLKYEFYHLEVEILFWCYRHYRDLTLMTNASTPYSPETPGPLSPAIRELYAQNHELSESLRQTMSVAYFLIDFHASYSHHCLPSPPPPSPPPPGVPKSPSPSSSSSSSSSSSLSERQRQTQKFKKVLQELEERILPELQHRLHRSYHARGKYYEFKLYQFMIAILSTEGEGEGEGERRREEIDELISLYRKAIVIWRELHQLEYYGTTYITIDPYKEGSRVMKMLGGLICYEGLSGTDYEEGIAYYREAQGLMELTLKGP